MKTKSKANKTANKNRKGGTMKTMYIQNELSPTVEGKKLLPYYLCIDTVSRTVYIADTRDYGTVHPDRPDEGVFQFEIPVLRMAAANKLLDDIRPLAEKLAKAHSEAKAICAKIEKNIANKKFGKKDIYVYRSARDLLRNTSNSELRRMVLEKGGTQKVAKHFSCEAEKNNFVVFDIEEEILRRLDAAEGDNE